MRILLVTDEYNEPGAGIGRFMVALEESSVSLGHDVTVMIVEEGTIAGNGPTAGPCVRVPAPAVGGVAQRSAARADAVQRAYLRLARQAAFDLVLVPVWNTLGLGLLDLPDHPIVSMVVTPLSIAATYNAGAMEHPEVLDQVAREERLLRSASVIHFLSDAVLRSVQGAMSLAGTSLFVAAVPSGMRPGDADRIPPPTSRPGQRRLLFVGRLEPRKGVDVLLDAIAQAHDEEPPPFSVDVVGDPSPRLAGGRTMIEIMRERHGGALWWESIRFRGCVADPALRALYAGADAVCIPSRYESQGLVAQEALQFARPLIVSDTGHLASLVEGNGWVVGPGDVGGLATALIEFAAKPSLASLGARSLELSRQFTSEVLTQKLLERAVRALGANRSLT